MRNRGYAYREVIGPRTAGRTVLQYLLGFGHTEEADWRLHLAEGRVTVDGRAAEAESVLRSGQELIWSRPPWEEPEAPRSTAVLFEDAHLLALAKPSGLPTLPGGGFLESTLLHLARARYPEAAPLHRLGRGTSGIVLFARTEAARAALARSFREHDLLKVYRALASGHPAADAFTVETPIGPVPHAWLGTVHAASPEGRPSRSEAMVLQRRGDGTTLLEVRIHTGRPHQIRIHLAAMGHPLVGDPLYLPGGHPRPDAVPGDLGYRLHALRLEGVNPLTGEAFRIFCQAPPELRP
ncbi:MAG TPA: RluA family pseudouridine synthase [Holophagaceae bacterium]|nr:RluA family pseudouridine synthase [Holophagaceae bacterium]